MKAFTAFGGTGSGLRWAQPSSPVTVSAVVPAYNEEGKVGATVRSLYQAGGITEVVVVDDGSTDRTAEEAEQVGARVVRLTRNLGKGRAVWEGVKRVTGEVILLVDADLVEVSALVSKLLEPVMEGKAEMTVASFPAGTGGGLGLAVTLARWGIWALTGWSPKAPLSGQRAVVRWLVEEGGPVHGFGLEVGLTVKALRRGYRVLEIEAEMPVDHAVTGRTWSGFVHRARQFLDIAAVLARLAVAR